jgi:hypothetical protein
MQARGGVGVQLNCFFNLGARWSGWSTPRPRRFTQGRDRVPIVQEAGWAQGPVWTGAENLALPGIRPPDLPAHSEWLFRLRYPDPWFTGLTAYSLVSGHRCCQVSAVCSLRQQVPPTSVPTFLGGSVMLGIEFYTRSHCYLSYPDELCQR